MSHIEKNYILAFDTATEHFSVAVINLNGDVLSSYGELAFRHLSDNLHPAIEKCMQEAGVEFKELCAIACTKGPGSFTSVRVGLAAAKGFSFALGIPLITFNSLEAIALGYLQCHKPQTNLHVWVEAHGGNVYCCTYNSKGEPIGEIESLPASIAGNKIAETDIIIGSGCQKHGEHIPNKATFNEEFIYVNAKHVALLGLSAFKENSHHVNDIKPLYIHPLHYHKTYNADGTPIVKDEA